VSDLNSLGLIIHASHGGRECPCYAVNNSGPTKGIVGNMSEYLWMDEEMGDLSDTLEASDHTPVMVSGGSAFTGTMMTDQPWGLYIPDTDQILVVTSNGAF